MSTGIHLAGVDDADRVMSLMQRHHEERALPHDDTHRAHVAAPLLEGSPLGAIWLIGPQRAPLGYVMISFGWSAELGGMIGWVEEIFVRASVRRRGIGTEVLHAVSVALRKADLRALHMRLSPADDAMTRFCARAGFQQGEALQLMTDRL